MLFQDSQRWFGAPNITLYGLFREIIPKYGCPSGSKILTKSGRGALYFSPVKNWNAYSFISRITIRSRTVWPASLPRSSDPFQVTGFEIALPIKVSASSNLYPGSGRPFSSWSSACNQPPALPSKFSSRRLPSNRSGGVVKVPPLYPTSAEINPSLRRVARKTPFFFWSFFQVFF